MTYENINMLLLMILLDLNQHCKIKQAVKSKLKIKIKERLQKNNKENIVPNIKDKRTYQNNRK